MGRIGVDVFVPVGNARSHRSCRYGLLSLLSIVLVMIPGVVYTRSIQIAVIAKTAIVPTCRELRLFPFVMV